MYEWCLAHYRMVLFVVAGVIPLIIQAKAIWFDGSGETVSVVWFSYTGFLAICTFLYGYTAHSEFIQANGIVRTIGHIPILLGLVARKGFTKFEKWIFVGLIFYILIMLRFPFQAWGFWVAMSAGLVVAILKQRREIKRDKSVGVVKWEVIVFRILGNLFWVGYGIYLGRYIVAIVSGAAFCALTLTLCTWWRYRKGEDDEIQNFMV